MKAALERGVTVVLATGKARPAAIAAMQTVGLAGGQLLGSFLSGWQQLLFLLALAEPIYGALTLPQLCHCLNWSCR